MIVAYTLLGLAIWVLLALVVPIKSKVLFLILSAPALAIMWMLIGIASFLMLFAEGIHDILQQNNGGSSDGDSKRKT